VVNVHTIVSQFYVQFVLHLIAWAMSHATLSCAAIDICFKYVQSLGSADDCCCKCAYLMTSSEVAHFLNLSILFLEFFLVIYWTRV